MAEREFRTESFTPAVAGQNGASSTFTNRFAWMAAQRVLPGGPRVALLFSGMVRYDLLFTIEDPLNEGYSLAIDTDFRGYLSTQFESGPGSGTAFASGTLMSATLETGAGSGSVINALSTETDVIVANASNPVINQLVSDAGSYDAGVFTGTRTFTLTFHTVGANATTGIGNFKNGEAVVRFGLDPSLTGFDHAGYPGRDGEAATGHGHFVTVSATGLGLTTVPDPAHSACCWRLRESSRSPRSAAGRARNEAFARCHKNQRNISATSNENTNAPAGSPRLRFGFAA